jgi:hypothetical protein
VSQLALPYRIALVALVAFAGLWFVALRPKSGSGTPSTPPAAQSQPTAPGVKGLTNAVAKAHNASAESDAANARIQAATGGSTAGAPAATAAPATAAPATAAKPLSSAASKPAVPAVKGLAVGDPSAPLLTALAKDKAVVLAFTGTAADDRSVARAIRQLSHRRGRVVVKIVPIGQVGHYTAITRGTQVATAPTTLVIGPNHEAQAIVGFTGTAELSQAIGDALAAPRK